MYKIDFKNGFSDCKDYAFPRKLKWFLQQLRLFNYIDLMKDYKESFFKSFITNKLPGPFVYRFNTWEGNQFEFDDPNDMGHSKYCGWCWDNIMIYFIKYIIRPSISNFLNNSKFNNDFYHNFAEKYYDKLATSVRNYTVESISLKSAVIPFETAFNNFIKSKSFEETIDDLFNIIIYKATHSVVEFKSTTNSGNVEKCNVSMYDLLFRPMIALKKISKHIHCEYEVEHPFAFEFDKTVSDNDYPISSSFDIHYSDINYKTFLNYVNVEKITEVDFKKMSDGPNYTVLYTVLKQIIRYVFVHQFKQSFGVYLNQIKIKDSNIDSIISDTDLFYTKYISSLKDNIKFYNESIDQCNELRKYEKTGEKKILLEKIQPILTSVQQYWFGTVSRNIDRSDNYYTVNSFVESSVMKMANKTFEFSDIDDLITTILDLKGYDSKMLENMYNYSFIDKWNEIINKKELVDTEDEYISKYSFEIA